MKKRLFNKIVLLAIALFFTELGLGQYFPNASFEGPAPGEHTPPPSWALCDGTPDTQPFVWDIQKMPSEGVSYVGMCWFNTYIEMITTELNDPFLQDSCYLFEIDLAFYDSLVWYGQVEINYPIKIQIYGAEDACGMNSLLWESPYIEHHNWLTYSFELQPEFDIETICIRTNSEPNGLPWPENIGYILMDNIQITAPPPFELGPDTTICNDTILLCLEGDYENIVWQDGSTDSCFAVTEPGIYWVDANNVGFSCPVSDTIVIDGGLSFSLGPDTSLAFCPGDSLVINAGGGFNTYLWNTGSEDSLIVIYESGTYWIEVTDDSDCIGRDTINVVIDPYVEMESTMGDSITACEVPDSNSFVIWAEVLYGTEPYTYQWLTLPDTTQIVSVFVESSTWFPVLITDQCGLTVLDSIKAVLFPRPVIDLGPDTLICPNGDYTLEAGGGYTQYTWQDGSNDSVFTITEPGIYYVEVINSYGCIGRDTVEIDLFPTVPLNLGNDTMLCVGETATLNGGSEFINFLWQDGSTDSIYTVSSTGIFWVTVMDEYGCSNSDSIQVGFLQAVLINLGNDTTVCSGDNYILNPGSGFAEYLWQNGSVDSYMEATSSGIYWVQVEDMYGCTGADTVQISLNPSPEINLGADTTICEGESLNLGFSNSYASYLWQDNSTSSEYFVYESGYYSVTVTNNYNCQGTDEIVVDIGSPEINIGPDTSLCFSDSIYLRPGEGFAYYEWQDGSNQSSYHVTSSGIYTVFVEDQFGCSDEDNVELILVLAPTVELDEDQVLCSGNTITLEAPVGPYTYFWNGDEGTATHNVTSGGEITVQLVNLCGEAIDNIYIEEIETPDVDLGEDILLNPDESIELNAGLGFDEYLWQDGSTNQFFLVNADDVINQDPNYFVEVSTGPCKGTDTVEVFVFVVELPAVFTPNNDGKNDLFLPMENSWIGITNHHISIFNRWGEQVWESEYFENGWDGKQNGKQVADGTYFWVLEVYYGPENLKQTLRGSLSVLGAN